MAKDFEGNLKWLNFYFSDNAVIDICTAININEEGTYVGISMLATNIDSI